MSVLARWAKTRSADWPEINLQDYVNLLNYNGAQYAPSPQTTLGFSAQEIVQNFQGQVQGALKSNGVVFACITARAQLFSEAVFKFRRQSQGRPGDMFGTPALAPLETPWTNATTGDLLARMSMDVDVAGNAYIAEGPPSPLDPTRTPTLRRLRPDWVTIVGGSRRGLDHESPLWQWDVEPIGYLYHPGGRGKGEVQVLEASQVAHMVLNPDPEAALVGMSPLQPIVQEVMADGAMTTHKKMFLENGATPNLVVNLPEAVTPDQFAKWVEAFDEEHEGVMNAYKTIYFGGGADVKVVGVNLRELSFGEVQSHGETRICMAFRMPPIIVGASEGLEAATYSNYFQALRAYADLTARPWWRNAAGSLQPLVRRPRGTTLWYDDRDIAFLREDGKDVAEIQVKQATATELYVRAGFEPDTIVAAMSNNDQTLLKHSGLASVQLQPIGAQAPKPAAKPPAKPAAMPSASSRAELERTERVSLQGEQLVTAASWRDGPPHVQCPVCLHYCEVRGEAAACRCTITWHVHELDHERAFAVVQAQLDKLHRRPRQRFVTEVPEQPVGQAFGPVTERGRKQLESELASSGATRRHEL